MCHFVCLHFTKFTKTKQRTNPQHNLIALKFSSFKRIAVSRRKPGAEWKRKRSKSVSNDDSHEQIHSVELCAFRRIIDNGNSLARKAHRGRIDVLVCTHNTSTRHNATQHNGTSNTASETKLTFAEHKRKGTQVTRRFKLFSLLHTQSHSQRCI